MTKFEILSCSPDPLAYIYAFGRTGVDVFQSGFATSTDSGQRTVNDADEEVGDLYSKPKEDEPYRLLWAERIGLGFSIGQLGPLNVVSISEAKVA